VGASTDGPIFWLPTIISWTRKATNFKLGKYIHRVHPNKNSKKIWEKRDCGCIQGLPNFFEYPPIISGMGKVTNFKFGRYIHRVHANKSPLKIWEKRERGRSLSRYCQNFSSTPIILGTGKATHFQFCTHILNIGRNKNPLEISGKVAVASQDCWNFSGHPYIGRIAAVVFAIVQLSCDTVLACDRQTDGCAIGSAVHSQLCWRVVKMKNKVMHTASNNHFTQTYLLTYSVFAKQEWNIVCRPIH